MRSTGQFVAFLAVFREGAETALFYQALFTRGGDIVMPVSIGLLSGSATLAVIFTLFWRFGLRIPLRPFFAVTSALLYYMALVFAGTGPGLELISLALVLLLIAGMRNAWDMATFMIMGGASADDNKDRFNG